MIVSGRYESKEPVIYGPSNFYQVANFTGGQCYTAIKQIRGFVGSILQPDWKLPKIVPDPRINTERDESSHTHLTVFTTLRSFRDKDFCYRFSLMELGTTDIIWT